MWALGCRLGSSGLGYKTHEGVRHIIVIQVRVCVCIDDMRRSAGRGDVRDGAAKRKAVYSVRGGPADGVDAGWDTVWVKIQTRDYLKPSSRSIALW